MPPRRFQFSLNPLWPHYLSWACVGVAIFLGLVRYGVIGMYSSLCKWILPVYTSVQTGVIPCTATLCFRGAGGLTRSTRIGSLTVRRKITVSHKSSALTAQWIRLHDAPVPTEGCRNMHELPEGSLRRRLCHEAIILPIRPRRRPHPANISAKRRAEACRLSIYLYVQYPAAILLGPIPQLYPHTRYPTSEISTKAVL